jgi:hypothetical protein
MTEANESTALIGGDPDFKEVYKDWQAVRIIRDNYFDVWKTFFTFYSWFGATMAGVGGYIISNRPFASADAHIVGSIGIVLIINVLLIAIVMFFVSRRYIRNIHSILERSGDLPFMQEKLLNTKAAKLFAASSVFGLTVGLAAWSYMMFFYYVRHG